MPRSLRDSASHAEGARPPRGLQDISASAPPSGQSSLAKRRIAEALAALLVAHYRRQQERAERERVPGA
jgi:hypothetical protein